MLISNYFIYYFLWRFFNHYFLARRCRYQRRPRRPGKQSSQRRWAAGSCLSRRRISHAGTSALRWLRWIRPDRLQHSRQPFVPNGERTGQSIEKCEPGRWNCYSCRLFEGRRQPGLFGPFPSGLQVGAVLPH